MVFALSLLLALTSAIDTRQAAATLNDKPVIGILSLDTFGNYPIPQNLTTYIAGSYVQWAEMAGSRVIPLILTEEVDTLVDLVGKINGVIFTGGGQDFFVSPTNATFTPYAERACAIFEEVKRQNDKGVHMPLWATCLGFELINVCVRPELNTMTGGFADEPPVTHPLDFTPGAERSRVYDNVIGRYVMRLYAHGDLALFAHHAGVTPATYEENAVLPEFYEVIATAKDRNGKEYVAQIEARDYPIYGSQFHPEKNIFEWNNVTTIPHSQEAVEVSTYLANFFMTEARKNFNSFGSEEALKPYLIYNYESFFVDGYFTDIYAFNGYV